MRLRLNQRELIDLGPSYYTEEEYEDCLHQLDRIARFLGGDRATYWAFDKLQKEPSSILEVGCGGGLSTIRLARRYPNAQVTGIDLSEQAIQFANQHLQMTNPLVTNIKFEISSSSELNYPPDSFDIITSTLVCHHMSDDEIISFLKRAYSIAKQAIILNDLHRHWFATMGFSTLTPLFFRNRLIIHDGLLSIKRAFTYQDWVTYLKAAQIPLNRCSITWHWAFRWIVFIHPSPRELK